MVSSDGGNASGGVRGEELSERDEEPRFPFYSLTRRLKAKERFPSTGVGNTKDGKTGIVVVAMHEVGMVGDRPRLGMLSKMVSCLNECLIYKRDILQHGHAKTERRYSAIADRDVCRRCTSGGMPENGPEGGKDGERGRQPEIL